MEDEIDRALNCRGAVAELPSAINEMTVAAWDAVICLQVLSSPKLGPSRV